MKILILSPKVPYPPRDGGSIATLGLASGLAEAGAEVTILCLNTSKHFSDAVILPETLFPALKIIPVYHDTEIHYTKALYNLFFSSEPYSGVRFISSQFEKNLVKLLQDENFDIIQIEGPYMGYYLPVLRKYSNAKISLRAHNVEYEIWERKAVNETNPVTQQYLSLLSRRIRKHESRIMKSVDLLVSISGKDRQLLLDMNPGLRSVNIPAGLDVKNYPELREPEFPSLFFIGSLDWMPNQEGLLWFIERVWTELHSDASLKLHIAGRNAPGWLEKKFLVPGIVYHGEVENASEFMNYFAIMISPIFSGSGMRVKILEAMMMKRLVISTKIGAEGISCTDGENILIADDPLLFASYIREYSGNRKKYDQVAATAREFVTENYNNRDFCRTLNEFYRSIT